MCYVCAHTLARLRKKGVVTTEQSREARAEVMAEIEASLEEASDLTRALVIAALIDSAEITHGMKQPEELKNLTETLQ